jgi:rifampicin phosphotransferase
MILTGDELTARVRTGDICIRPFIPDNVNPNSYNFRLDRRMRVYCDEVLDVRQEHRTEIIDIGEKGYVLEPYRLYLASTIEVMGSRRFVPTYAARSSVARLGMFINLSASLGDIGFIGRWTIQLFAINRIRVYAGMKIGQIMFWQVQGRIKLYSGKYQGSSEACASRIFMDFRQSERPLVSDDNNSLQLPKQSSDSNRLLGAPMSTRIPAKYRTLSELSARFDVPSAVHIDQEFLSRLFPTLDAVAVQAAAIVDRVFRTAGSRLGEDIDEMNHILDHVVPDSSNDTILDQKMVRGFNSSWPSVEFAVRSAAHVEDSHARSFAGIFESVLCVRGSHAIQEAILQVWRSGFSRRALVEHLSNGMAPKPVDVIIQKMIKPRLAGVAFSRDPLGGRGVLINYTEGLGDALVSGQEEGHRVTVADGSLYSKHLPTAYRKELLNVARLTEQVSDTLGYDVDIEWAADEERVWLLQARPITTGDDAQRAFSPVLAIADLYGSETQVGPLRPLPSFGDYFRSKRRRIWEFAEQHGLARGAALVVRANRPGLEDGTLAQALAERCDGPEAVIDFSDHIRQVIVRREDLIRHVRALMRDPTRVHCFIVRAFFRGDIGLISQVMDSGEGSDSPAVLLEWTTEGLLALNRGTANTHHAVLGPDSLPNGLALAPHLIKALRAATIAAQVEIGRIQVEWVVASGQLYPIDFSPLKAQASLQIGGTGVILSRGYAEGPTLVIRASEELNILSVAPVVSLNEVPMAEDLGPTFSSLLASIKALQQPPIIVAARPYAALAALIPHAAGFVFERGSLLCHLAILLRERGLPAVQGPDLFDAAQSYQRIALEAYGTVTLAAQPYVGAPKDNNQKPVSALVCGT